VNVDDLPPRIRGKIDPRPDGCWWWTATVSGGYGSVWWDGRLQAAHRVVYGILVGPIPGDPRRVVLHHVCRNKRCVNPAHVRVTSQSGNVRRAVLFRRFRVQR
jgi:HNH endonuclease